MHEEALGSIPSITKIKQGRGGKESEPYHYSVSILWGRANYQLDVVAHTCNLSYLGDGDHE
jgi:hypothetical protein